MAHVVISISVAFAMIRAEGEMAKSKQGPSFKLRYTSEVTVSAPEFQASPSLQYVDREALSLASKARIDVGFFKSPCCERHVHAVIERGIVVGLDMAPCSESTAPPPEEIAFVTAALKRAGRSSTRKWKPIPVRSFLAGTAELVQAETNCIEFTIWGHTFFCCRTDNGPISCVHIGPIRGRL
jgi:hypothetical protein